jgi:hypothetical protein
MEHGEEISNFGFIILKLRSQNAESRIQKIKTGTSLCFLLAPEFFSYAL